MNWDSSNGDNYPTIEIGDFTAGKGGYPQLLFFVDRGGSGTDAAVQNGDVLGDIEAGGATDSSGDSGEGADIFFVAEGNFSTSSYPTAITFDTTASGSTTINERMRITNAGRVGIGTTSPTQALDVNGQIHVGTLAAASGTSICRNANVLSSCSSSKRYKENVKDSG